MTHRKIFNILLQMNYFNDSANEYAKNILIFLQV